jgi:hypothetical protein
MRPDIICLKSKIFIVLLIMSSLCIGLPAQVNQEDWQKPLEYEVQVQAQVVPFFAVDEKGDPVYDLKEGELSLFVNDKRTPIIQFRNYQFEDETGQAVQGGPQRIVFVIIDSVFNSTAGLKRAKEIAWGIVEAAPRGDAFVILESKPAGGLHHVWGPGNEKKALKKALQNTAKLSEVRMRMGQEKKSLSEARRFSRTKEDLRQEAMRVFKNIEIAKDRYRTDLRRFAYAISQFKFALKTITLPKIVYLMSQGISRGALADAWDPSETYQETALYQTQAFYYKYLTEMARSVNTGGCMLYLIDPDRPRLDDDFDTSGKESLKFMASVSGGKYFGGSDAGKIVHRVGKSTAAYYEMVFYLKAVADDKMEIRIDCTRDGVQINTIRYSERSKPYIQMEPLQKKLFALNVVNGGSWSRMSGTVEAGKFKKMKKKGGGDVVILQIRVPLPQPMHNRDLDVYLVNVDPQTQKAAFGISSQKASDYIGMDIPVVKEKGQYFVIIDPDRTHCLYNRVR